MCIENWAEGKSYRVTIIYTKSSDYWEQQANNIDEISKYISLIKLV